MIKQYERSYDELYPITYHTFKGISVDGNEQVEYYIQDLPQDKAHIDEAVDLVCKYLIPDETFQKAVKLAENDDAMELVRKIYREIFQKGVSLACFVSGSDKLIGVNALVVGTMGINEEEKEIDIKEVNEMINIFKYVSGKFNVFEHFNVNHYLYGIGLCVNTDYRGHSIATEILKARKPLLKCLNLTVTSTLFTTIGSQKAAVNAGYEEKHSTTYKEISSRFPTLDFSHADTSDCKTLAIKIE